MPKQVLQITNFAGGLNAYSDARDIEDNQFVQNWNAVVDKNGIIRVSGMAEDSIATEYFDNTNFQKGHGLFQFTADYSLSGIDGNFKTGIKTGTLSAYDATDSDHSNSPTVTLETTVALHGSAQTYRFHNGTSLNANGDIIWAGNQYLKMPIQAEGFAFQKGQLPRPTLTISNALGTITAILLNVNSITTGNDLTGATVTRIRTLARYLDSINFPGNTNPLGTPDPTAEFPQEIYKIDRKSSENREAVQFELAAVFDLAGIRAPKRQCTRTEFPSIGTFIA